MSAGSLSQNLENRMWEEGLAFLVLLGGSKTFLFLLGPWLHVSVCRWLYCSFSPRWLVNDVVKTRMKPVRGVLWGRKHSIICCRETLASCFPSYEAGQEAEVNLPRRTIETFVSPDCFSPLEAPTGGGEDGERSSSIICTQPPPVCLAVCSSRQMNYKASVKWTWFSSRIKPIRTAFST